MTIKELKQLFRYLKANDILLVNGEEVGEVELPEVDEGFILDDLADDIIKNY